VNRRVPVLLACALLPVIAACGDRPAGPTPDVDAGTDAGSLVAAPLPPVLTPCPAGWREVTDASGSVTCDPWPATGYRTDCAWDEAHFAGTPGCARVGTDCPADDWPAELPTDRVIVYVDDSATPGGDGSTRATALTSIAAGLAAAPSGAVVAVAIGGYDEVLRVSGGRTLWGACVSGTRIVTSAPAATDAAITLSGAGTGVRNLGVDGPERLGIAVSSGTGVSIDSVVISGATVLGVYLDGGSSSLTDVVVRRTRAQSDGTYGRGIEVETGAQVTLSRVLLDDNREIGLFAMSAGTSVQASDLVVRGTRERSPGGIAGRGIDVETGARLVLSRALVEDNREAGLFVSQVGTSVEATDLVVRGTRERAGDGTMGRGVEVETGAHLALSRAYIIDNRVDGILSRGTGTTADVTDVVVRGTRERTSDASYGRGMDVWAGAHVVLARVVLDDNRETGLLVDGADTTVNATDITIRETGPESVDASDGSGLWAQNEAHVVVGGARIEASHWVGLGAIGRASVQAQDVVVSGVEPSRCRGTLCVGDTGGFGLVAATGGALTATRFAVVDASLCGVVVGRNDLTPSALDLANGVIDRSMIGACVQLDGYDTSRLQVGVEYRDVGVPLRATSYELPSSLAL
jgi:hypothetical protein